MLDLSEYVIEFVLKLAMNADKMNEVEIDPSNTSVTFPFRNHALQ